MEENILQTNDVSASIAKTILKAKRIAQLFHHDSKLTSELRSDLKSRDIALGIVIQCVETHWYSLFSMLERMQRIMDSICTVLMGTNHNVSLFTPDELEDLDDIVKLLSPFADITNDMNGQIYCTVSLIIPTTKCLLEKVQQTQVKSIRCHKFKEELESEIKKRLVPYESMLICR